MASTSLYDILREAGFQGGGLDMAYAIVMAESGGKAHATNTKGNSHGVDRGLFQINSYYHPEVSDAEAFDPLANAKAAYRISNGGKSWSQWATYNNGAYQQYMPRGGLGRGVSSMPDVQVTGGGGGSTVLKVGSRGSDVTALQKKLGIKADGIYGPQTENAVKQYQKRNKLTVDGIAGPQTLGALGLASSADPSAMSNADLASQYGYQSAFFDTDPSLKKLINQAVAEGWSQEKFDAELKNTPWYQKHTASQRQWEIASTDDPAEAKRQLQVREKAIKEQAVGLGVRMSAGDINKFALQSLQNGLTDAEIQQGLSAHLAYRPGKSFEGTAGVTEQQYTSMAHDMGLSLSPKAIETWVRRTMAGWNTQDDYTTYLRDLAKSAFPGISKQLDQGMTVADIASPYVQQMASTLELDPESIDFSKDPLIRGAFSYTAHNPTTPGAGRDPHAGGTGTPGLMPLWQFDQQVKQDPRWLKTENAHNSLMDVTTGILKDWGVMS